MLLLLLPQPLQLPQQPLRRSTMLAIHHRTAVSLAAAAAAAAAAAGCRLTPGAAGTQ